MFEVLVFMFENYFANQSMPDDVTMEQELSAAGFEQNDILGAFDWFQEMKSMLNAPELDYSHHERSIRLFTMSVN